MVAETVEVEGRRTRHARVPLSIHDTVPHIVLAQVVLHLNFVVCHTVKNLKVKVKVLVPVPVKVKVSVKVKVKVLVPFLSKLRLTLALRLKC